MDDSRRVGMVNKTMSKKNLYHAEGELSLFYTEMLLVSQKLRLYNRGLKMLITKWKYLLNLL